MLDLNVLLDVVQQRRSHYRASAAVLDFALKNNCGCIAAHMLTTMHYLVTKYAEKQQADDLIDWLLQNFTVVPADKTVFLRARSLGFSDFEDAVVCASAQEHHCRFIITRNTKDFTQSNNQALTPAEFLAMQ
ncbi:type II toxin-antitoxin system VapC family toxin [Geoalkalibacter halelectricus]|uniref:PIN domain-containing protein n=1 Tax=Geoalkalibacter halelectricus TaxID=2847045 RepID=A0ABY5ZSW8_9BACT|nr:PIN domain-containing protein [Geoalkalibacter halelectricus]MDO3379757.1 PIN domain-containing protein [Geoalkalibacter halelectricus]UWZ81614.1 PIN domain-containing protein [Geoalkalibacter halelectricus]